MAKNQIQFSVGFSIDKSSLNGITKDLESVQDKAKKALATGTLDEGLKKASISAQKLESILKGSWSEKLNQVDTYKLNSGIRQAFGNMSNFKKELTSIGPEGAAAYNQITGAILNTNTQLRTGSKLLNDMATSMGNTVKWGITAGIFNNITRSIQSAWSYTQHLDKSLNSIRVVSGESAANMEKFAKQANAAAQSLGSSTLDYTDAALIYYQQGLSDEEVNKRTEITLKMANVLGLEASEVSNYMTAIWNNFDDGSKSLEYFGDVVASLGANTASSATEIAEGLNKFAAVADTVGLSYEYATSALATVVASTRQSADIVGTAFKTLFARIQDLELGETLEDGTTIGKYAEGLAAVGISIKDSSGELKKMDVILNEMGQTWGTLNKDQQVALAQTVAGTRQYTQLVALMDNWDGAMQENLKIATESAGTLEKQQGTYMESMAAHFQKLSTAWQRSYDIIFNPDTMDETVDVLTSLVETFNDFIEGINGGAKAITYFATLFTTLFSKQIADSLSRVSTNLATFRQNKNILKSQQELVDQDLSNQLQATNVESGRGMIGKEGLEEQVRLNKEILANAHLLTSEQQEQLKNMAQEIAYYRHEETVLKRKEEQLKKENKIRSKEQQEQDRQILKEHDENFIPQSNEEGIKELQQRIDKVRELKEALEELKEKQNSEAITDQFFIEEEGSTTANNVETIEQSIQRIYADVEAVPEALRTTENLESAISAEIQRQEEYEEALNRELVEAENSIGRTAESSEAMHDHLEGSFNTVIRNSQKTNQIQKAVQLISAGTRAISVVIGTIQTLISASNDELDKTEKKILKIEAGFSAASGLASTLGTAIGAAWGTTGAMVGTAIGTTVGSLISLVGSVVKGEREKAAKEAKEIAEQAAKDLEENRKKIEELTSSKDTFSTPETKEEWQELVHGVDEYGNNLTLTNEQYNKYLEYCKEMASIDDSLVDGYNRQGQAIITQANAMDKLNKSIEEQLALAKKESVSGTQWDATVAEIKSGSKEAKKEIENLYRSSLKDTIFMVNSTEGKKKKYTLEDLLVETTRNKKDYTEFLGEDEVLDYEEILDNYEEIVERYREKLISGGYRSDEISLPHEMTESRKEELLEIREEAEKKKKEASYISDARNAVLTKAFYDNDEAIQKYLEMSNEEISLITSMVNKWTPDTDEVTEDDINKKTEETQEFIDWLSSQSEETIELIENLQNLDFKTQEEYQEAVSKLKSILEESKLDSGLKKSIEIPLGLVKIQDNDPDILLSDDQVKKLKNSIVDAFAAQGLEVPVNLDNLSIEELQEFESVVTKVGTTLNENSYKFFRFSKISEDFAESLGVLELKINAADTALSDFKKDGILSQETFKTLVDQYKELNKYKLEDTSTHEFIAAVREARELTEKEYMDSLENENQRIREFIPTYQEEIEEIREKILNAGPGVETSDMEEQLESLISQYEIAVQNLLDNDYKIKLQIEADLETDVENAFGLADEFEKLKSYISDDLTVTAEKAQEIIAAGYGGMLENARATADGSILLDKAVMNAYIEHRQIELEKDKQAKIQQLENQKAILVAQRAVLQAKLDAIEKALNAQTEEEAATALQEIKIQDTKYQNQVKLLNSELNTEAEVAEEEENINQQLYTLLGGMYKDSSQNLQTAEKDATDFQAEEIETRLKNVEILYNGYKNLSRAVRSSVTGEDPGKFEVEGQIGSGREIIDSELKDIETGDINVNETTAKSIGDFAKEFETEEYKATMEALRRATQEEIDTLDKQIGGIDAGIAALETSSLALDTAQETAKEKEKNTLDLLEDEIDRYHEVDLALKEIKTDLDRLSKAQNNLFGKDLIDNLNKQLDLLESQKIVTEQKLDLAKQESAEIRNKLSIQGVHFGLDGSIENYASILQSKLNYVNNLITQYNSMSEDEQKNFKDTVEEAKKDYEEFKKNIEDYDKLISDTIPGLEDSLQEAVNKQIEINIKKFTAEVEVRLNMAKAEQDFNNFKRKIIQGLEDDDILGNAKAGIEDLMSYFNTAGSGTGPIQSLTEQIDNTLDQLKELDSFGTSSMYGMNRNQALGDLQKYYQELMNQLESEDNLVEKIKEKYLDMIDEAISKFDKQISQYEYVNDILKHDMNLIGLIYGDKAYSEMENYYKKIEENDNKQIDFLRQSVAYAEKMMNAETDPEARKKWQEEWEKTLKSLNSTVDNAIKNIQDKYSNGINKVFKEWEERITGGVDLDYFEDSWNRLVNLSEAYLDNINRTYEIQSLENKFIQAIDDTDSIAAQTTLRNVMEEQLGILREKKNVSEYDIERANKIYELTLKQIALEDAQNNKNQMRLRRDSQGNYNFQYVADQDEIAKARQELMEAQAELYNFDKEHYKQNLEDAFTLTKEWEEKVKAIMLDMTLDDEEKQNRRAEIDEYYEQRITDLTEENAEVRKNLLQDAYMAIDGFQEDSLKSFLNMSQSEQDEFMGNLIPMWESGLQIMIDNFAGAGGFIPSCQDALDELNNVTQDYENELDLLERTAGYSFSNIANGIDNNVYKVQNLIDENSQLIRQYDEQVNAVQKVMNQLDNLISKYGSAQQAAINATQAAYNYWQQAQQAAAVSYSNPNYTPTGTGVTTSNVATNVSSNVIKAASSLGNLIKNGIQSVANNVNINKANGKLEVGDVVSPNKITDLRLQAYGYPEEISVVSGLSPRTSLEVTQILKDGGHPVEVLVKDSPAKGVKGWMKKEDIDPSTYDTGGYTGNWNSSQGRLAVLHEKELVLKASDTENILSAVNFVRGMDSILNALNQSTSNRVAGLLSNISDSIGILNKLNQGQLEQNVHIQAEFPNVEKANEIEKAFNNLVNLATQRAFRNNR